MMNPVAVSLQSMVPFEASGDLGFRPSAIPDEESGRSYPWSLANVTTVEVNDVTQDVTEIEKNFNQISFKTTRMGAFNTTITDQRKNRMEAVTQEVEKLLAAEGFEESMEFNIRRISLEVISFILSLSDKESNLNELEKMTESTVQKLLEVKKKKEMLESESMLTEETLSDESKEPETIAEIFERLVCKCGTTPVKLSSFSKLKYQIQERERYKLRTKRRELEKKKVKDWETAYEKTRRMQGRHSDEKRQKKERKEMKEKRQEERLRKTITDTDRLLEEEEGSEEAQIEVTSYQKQVLDIQTLRMITMSVGHTMTKLRLYREELFTTQPVYPQEEEESIEELTSLYTTKDEGELKQFLEIKKFAYDFVDEISKVAEKMINDTSQSPSKVFSDQSFFKVDFKDGDIDVKSEEQVKIEIGEFRPEVGSKAIITFIDSWRCEKCWAYCINFTAMESDSTSDYFIYEVKFSMPTELYPIPQATASVFFRMEVSRIKPLKCPVNITYYFEGRSLVYDMDTVVQQETCLTDIIDCKLSLFKSVDF